MWWWRALVEVVFPTLCPGCGRRADPVCPDCARTLRAPPPAAAPAGLDGWLAPLAYEGVVRELVARVKYRHVRAAVPWLAAAVAGAVAARHARGAFDAVTWAPTTPDRRRRRGFDHAELLARGVAGRLGLPVTVTLARRPGPPQTGLPSCARRAGPAFRPLSPVPSRLLLIDDVTTTGATLAAAARALRSSGAERIVAATAARTPPSRPRRTSGHSQRDCSHVE
jgi:predicted amidophosphoribosyltransferase